MTLPALLLSAVAAATAGAAPPAAPAKPPNVVLIISDDHAWTDYGFMGHAHIRTPHLDKLAAESLTFRRGYVPSSLCCPSLASIITGLYPHQHKITSNDPPLPKDVKRNDPRWKAAFEQGREVMSRHMEAVPTLPRMLRDRGYLCLQTGKWWQGDFRRGGFTHGMTKGGRHGDDGLTIGRKTMQPIHDFIAEARKADKPFLVWYAPLLPHDPHTPPDRLLAKYRDKTPSLHVAKYWAQVEWFDETCGELLAHLDKQGLADNTIVVYVADNGWIQNPDSPRYAPKSKQSPYDGGLRTPMMIRFPGKVKPRMADEPASSVDLMPTVLGLLGVPATAEMTGIDLLDEAALKARPAIFGECFTHDAVDLNDPAKSLRWRWVLEGRHKLIVPADGSAPELYDVTADPTEVKNLAAARPEVVEPLRRRLDGWWNPGR